MRTRTGQWLVAVLAVWQVVAAALSQSGVLPGEQVGTISDRYDSAVDPAGYAFSIWGLIYVLSFAFAWYQLVARRRDDALLARVRPWTAAAFTLSGVWILVFQQEWFALAQTIIVALTVTLAVAYANVGRQGPARSLSERWLVFTPIGLYLGWATVASIAGASTTLMTLDVTSLGLSATAWAVVLLFVAAGIAGFVTLAGPSEPGFPLAVAWALLAIVVEQSADRPAAATAAGIAAAVTLVAFVLRERRHAAGPVPTDDRRVHDGPAID